MTKQTATTSKVTCWACGCEMSVDEATAERNGRHHCSDWRGCEQRRDERRSA